MDKKETNHDEDPSGSQTKKKCVNQIFAKMFEDLNKSFYKSSTVFKVNVGLRQSNPDAYTPKIVSIGPNHRKNPQLGPMEEYKLLYLRRFLQRREGLDVKYWIGLLEDMEEEARMYYDDIEDLDTDEFCKMLLLDGCFVVEFIREERECCQMSSEILFKIIDFVDYKYNQILRDLLLLENQLPFFILNKLHDLTEQDTGLRLETLAITFFSHVVNLGYIYNNRMDLKIFDTERRDMKHLLEVVHVASCPMNCMKLSNDINDTKWNKVMPNATELSEAGVKFAKVMNHTTSLFNIDFENGLMTIPYLEVVDSTETLLRNFIAYEQQSIDLGYSYFSDYAIFMDQLIDSDQDVSLLRRQKIIANWIGGDKEVASLFNKIGNGVTTYSNFYYRKVFLEAVKHCDEKPWNRMKASLKHNYFSNPWVGASTMTAIILLILTAIQTILAIISAFKGNK